MSISPQIIESPRAMRQFFDSSPDIKKVTKLAGKPPYEPPREHGLVAPFKAVAFRVGVIFFSKMHSLLQDIGMDNLAIRANVCERHCKASFYRLRRYIFGHAYFKESLGSMTNQYRLDISNYYLLPPTQTSIGKFQYYHPSGLCSSITTWFNYLYLKTRSEFSSPEHHIQAISRRFRKGASIPAAFINSLFKSFHKSSSYSKIYKKPCKRIPDALKIVKGADVFTLSSKKNPIQTLAKKIYSLPQGCYYISFPSKTKRHAISFIRDKQKRFFIDPNIGAFSILQPEALQFFIGRYQTDQNLTKSPPIKVKIFKLAR